MLQRWVPLLVVHAWDEPVAATPGFGYVPPRPEEGASTHDAAQRLLAEATAGLAADYPDLVVIASSPGARRKRCYGTSDKKAEMLVVGRHRQTGPGFFALGPVVRSLVNTAPCPVLVTAAAVPPSRTQTRLRSGDDQYVV